MRERLGSPYASAGATRCRGLLLSAEGELSAAQETFERSLGRRRAVSAGARPHPALPRSSASASAAEARGARGAGAGARYLRGPRRPAVGGQGPVGAPTDQRSSPAPDELTETERRVAELAAQGRTNKEIAAELFMGVSTVEAHLSHVYRKLAIRSRTNLPGGSPRRGRSRPTLAPAAGSPGRRVPLRVRRRGNASVPGTARALRLTVSGPRVEAPLRLQPHHHDDHEGGGVPSTRPSSRVRARARDRRWWLVA